MSDYNQNSSGRGNRGPRRRRGGKRRHNDAYDSREPRAPKAAPPSGFQKFLSVISFGLLGKKEPISKAYANGAPQPIRTPREPGTAASSSTGPNRERDRDREDREDRGPRGDREQRREKRPSPVSTEVTGERLYVGNLSYDAAESDLLELFHGSGQVQNAEVVVNSRTQRSKGFAFVTMMTIEDAKKAVADLNGKEFMGRPLVVGGAKPLTPREERGDRGGYDRDHGHDEQREEHHDSSEQAPRADSTEEHQNASV